MSARISNGILDMQVKIKGALSVNVNTKVLKVVELCFGSFIVFIRGVYG